MHPIIAARFQTVLADITPSHPHIKLTFQETTMNGPTRLPRILAAAMFAALTCSIATVSFASDSFDDLQVKIKYADLDMSSASDAAVLYMRIQGAAEAVCRSLKNPDLYYRRLFSACVRKAMSKAIDEVNQPVLYAIANAKTGTH